MSMKKIIQIFLKSENVKVILVNIKYLILFIFFELIIRWKIKNNHSITKQYYTKCNMKSSDNGVDSNIIPIRGGIGTPEEIYF